MFDEIKKLLLKSNLIFRIWVVAVIIIVIFAIDNNAPFSDLIFKVPMLAAPLYLILIILEWLIDGFKQIEKNSFGERLAKAIVATLLFLAIYYLISPLQICRRTYPYQDKSFCIQHASW